MKVLIGCLMLVVVAIAAALAWPLVSSSPRQKPKVAISSNSAPRVAISSNSAETVVSEAVNQAANYNPEVACPQEIIGEKGTVFRCEALVRGRLIPIDVKIVSELGFIRVVGTAPLRRLEEETENEEAIDAEEEAAEEERGQTEEQRAQEAECHEGWRQAVFQECLAEVRALHP